jgi:hypothetical protein
MSAIKKPKSPMEIQIDLQIMALHRKGKLSGDLNSLKKDLELRERIESRIRGVKI